MDIRIATWNINSFRLRLPLVERLVAELTPDVICLQETKVPDELFPAQAAMDLGYDHILFRGMKSYNGVSIFSRVPMTLTADAPDWCGKTDCRHLGVLLDTPTGPLELHNFYVPAGGDIPDRDANPKFGHKLDFVAEATDWFAARKNLGRCVLVGDLNIAPLEHDVWSHKQLLDVVSHTPVETEALLRWQAQGFVDAMRHFVPADQKLYTWWSYRNRDWRVANRGRRLDHVWATPDLNPKKLRILQDARDWTQTSDHVPVAMDFDLG